MRRPFDRFGKNLGKEALERSGRTVVQFEISRDAQHADLWHAPDPARMVERARLGLLGRIASVLCLIELYAHAPSADELPPEADERILAEDGLAPLQQVLAKVSSRTPEEEEFVVRMLSPWEKATREGHEKGRLQGRQEGRQEGRLEGEARALLTVLRGRGMVVPNATRARILAEKDPARLERWLKRALVATAIAEVLDEPN